MKQAEVRAALGRKAQEVLQKLHQSGLIVVSEAEHMQALRKAEAYDKLRSLVDDTQGG